MLVRNNQWEKIRTKFNEEEKEKLRAATVGQVICPAGNVIEPGRLSDALLKKLEDEIRKVENSK